MDLAWMRRASRLTNAPRPARGLPGCDADRNLGAARPAAYQTLRRFLLGEPVKRPDLKRSGIHGVKGSVTKRNAERVLQTLACVSRQSGSPPL